jgi:hypothetical protein
MSTLQLLGLVVAHILYCPHFVIGKISKIIFCIKLRVTIIQIFLGFPGGLTRNIKDDSINTNEWDSLVRIRIEFSLPRNKSTSQSCHGVAITNKKIITAAHCLFHPEHNVSTQMKVAVTFFNTEEKLQECFTITDGFTTIVHPQFNR